MQKRLLYASLAAGCVSITVQSLILRELVIVFLGNELVIGMTLGAWLLWTGLGSATLGRWAERSQNPAGALALQFAGLALALPLTFIAANWAREFAGLTRGEIVGPGFVAFACLVLLCPLCVFNGAIFPALCRMLSERRTDGSAIARVYVWEAIGSAAGGVLFSAAIIQMGRPFYAALASSVAAVLLAFVVRPRHSRRTLVALGLLSLFLLSIGLGALSLRPATESLGTRHRLNTIYGRTRIEQFEGTTSVFHNGVLSATYPPVGTTERLVHLAMLQVQAPRRVLLIGGLSGAAEEALKYAGVQTDIVELDPEAVAFVRRLAPPSPALADALRRGRARLLFRDGRRHVVRHRGAPYDAVILSLPPPVTAQINRYYTVEFFRAVRRILSANGALAFSVESAPNIATIELREYIGCLRRTLAAAFAEVAVAPGEFNTFLAARESGQLTLDPDTLLARLNSRRVPTKHFDATLQGDLIPFKIDELREILAESTSARLNSDLHPISYSHGLMVWSAKQRTPRAGALDAFLNAPVQWLTAFRRQPPLVQWSCAVACLIGCSALLALLRIRRRSAAALAVAFSGFTEITIEIIALLAFQALYGYVYVMLGLVLASFMVGLCAGGACSARIIREGRASYASLLRTQAALAAYPLVLVVVITAAWSVPDWLVAGVFLALTFVAGLIGGMQFPLAAWAAGDEGQRMAARFSALDLCGAAAGAFAVSAFFIPGLGFIALSVLLSGLGVVALAGLLVARAPS